MDGVATGNGAPEVSRCLNTTYPVPGTKYQISYFGILI